MKTRDIIGRKIVKVNQVRTQTDYGDTIYDVRSVELDNGTKLVFTVVELPSDYAVEVMVLRPGTEYTA